jgi:bifunctional DNA-binding transcriptional regulator/antitoxin component of YhaV-PrlF toxin-antitoxin module
VDVAATVTSKSQVTIPKQIRTHRESSQEIMWCYRVEGKQDARDEAG